jgi:small-conductance mechanosensitive channel
MLGYGFSALSFVLVAVALLLLKPRVPARESRQPVEEYWSSVTSTILPMWFVMEAAGLIAIVGYFLTGQSVAAVAIAISIGAFIWYGPKAFVQP